MNQQSTCLQSDIETLIRSGPPTVLLDANVLVPQYLRAVLLELAEARLFRPHWSKHILEEVRRNLAGLQSRYRLPTERVDRLLALMQTSFSSRRTRATFRSARSLELRRSLRGRTPSCKQCSPYGQRSVSQRCQRSASAYAVLR
ncbi:PIN domain-containing protein [Roseateles sp.]|uniref:PIN domain-containing protein n=1 Tax=Roseateles sp. TaxID=1971397 RepID=UPI0031DAE639